MKPATILSQAILTNCLLLISSRSTTMAFTTSTKISPLSHFPPALLHATLTAEELSTMDKAEQLKALGVDSEERLALGIDPDEVLEFLGTREDLINKFQADIPKLSTDRTLAESEVDKFLVDGEMLDLFIKYSQRKREDPTWEPQYAPDDNSPIGKISSFASQYAIWIVGGILLKDLITNFMNKSDGGGIIGV